MNNWNQGDYRISRRWGGERFSLGSVLLALLLLLISGVIACSETQQQKAEREQREASIRMDGWREGYTRGVERAAAVERELSEVKKQLDQAIAAKIQARIDAEEWLRKELRRRFPGSPPPFEGWRGKIYRGMVMMGAYEFLLALLFACGFLIINGSTLRERVGMAITIALGAVVAIWLSSGFWKGIESSLAVLLAPANRFGIDWLVAGLFFAVATFLANAYFFRVFVIDQRRGVGAALGAFVFSAIATAYVFAMPLVLKLNEQLGTEITQHLASHIFLGVLIGGTVHLIWLFITYPGPLLRRPRSRLSGKTKERHMMAG